MANSTTNIDNIYSNQAGKEVTANAYFDAASPATVYGRRASSSGGLVWAFYGGTVYAAGAPLQIANGTLTLTASTANIYIEANQTTGAVTQNNTGWTPGRTPLYKVTTGASTVSSYTDYRTVQAPQCSIASLAIISSTAVFQYAESNSRIVLLTGTPAVDFAVTLSARPWVYAIQNTTANIATFTTGTGTTVSIGAGKCAQIFTDGTQVVRLSADV